MRVGRQRDPNPRPKEKHNQQLTRQPPRLRLRDPRQRWFDRTRLRVAAHGRWTAPVGQRVRSACAESFKADKGTPSRSRARCAPSTGEGRSSGWSRRTCVPEKDRSPGRGSSGRLLEGPIRGLGSDCKRGSVSAHHQPRPPPARGSCRVRDRSGIPTVSLRARRCSEEPGPSKRGDAQISFL